ncbi:hypothetical protein DID80_01790 [Candidatus Marinamargulisbacteria bacterium SCGC AAA071-K20]|nr:hypothetical protein DID80_01790 [Candidatus Marinamargulisbacteria bacterium SCGC AAA071-K20]
MIRLIISALFLVFSLSLFADERVYQRKSISSPAFVWISDKHLDSRQFLPDQTLLGKNLEQQLLLQRFDHNVLPDAVLNPLRDALENTDSVNADEISDLFEGFVVNDILDILNDQTTQKERSLELKNNNRRVTLAETKGKIDSLTKDELETLMNSAYFFFPYITQTSQNISQYGENARVKVSVQGGVLWYRIVSDGNGQKGIEQIAHTKSMATGTTSVTMPEVKNLLDLVLKTDEPRIKRYKRLNSETLSKEVFQDAFFKAFNNWALNLTVQVKNISDFKLRTPIKDAIGSKYTIDLTKKDGLKTDDSFYLMHYVEENGQEKQKKVGYGRVNKISKVEGQFSTFSQVLGKNQLAGGWIEEHAKSGLSVEVGFGSLNNLNLGKDAFLITIPNPTNPFQTVSRQLLDSDSKSGTSFKFRLNQNLAPFTDISQFFIFFDTGVTTLKAESSSEVIGSPVLLHFFGGVSKKFWLKSRSIGVQSGIGGNQLSFNGRVSGSKYDYSVNTVALMYGLRFEQQLNSNWSVYIQSNLFTRLGPSSTTLSINDEEVSTEGVSEDNIDINGTEFIFGIKYDLNSFNMGGLVSFFDFM